MITISIQNAIAIVIASMSLGITISNAVQFFIISREEKNDNPRENQESY